MADREKRLLRKTFNSVAGAFFREMGKVFANDAKMTFLSEELHRLSKTKDKDHVPAMQFFKAMNTSTGLISVTDIGAIAVVGELVLTHDERLFAPECNVVIPQLDAIDFKTKWAQLSQENRQFVWGYLERMAQLSAKVAASMVINESDVMGLMSAIGAVAGAVDTTIPDHEKIKVVMADPEVAAIAQNISDRMNK